MCAMLTAPLAVVDVPPLLDYPNHLARLFVLAFGPGDPILARFYQARWTVIPDLGIDLAGPPLLRLWPVHVAGRIVAGCVLLLSVLGAIAYSRATLGYRSWWALGAALVAYNQTFLLGFLNFTAGMGLALLLASAWLRWRDPFPGSLLVLSAAGTVGLFFCHLMGVVFFALLIASHELTRIWALVRNHPREWRALVNRIAAGLIVFSAPALLYLSTDLHHESTGTAFLSPMDKASQLLVPVVNYDLRLDLLTAAAIAGAVSVLAVRHRLLIPARSRITLCLVIALYAVSPFAFKGVFNLDTRFAVLLGFLLFASIAPAPLSRAGALCLAGLMITLFAARMALVLFLWSDHAARVQGVRMVMAAIPPGAVVLSTLGDGGADGDRRLSARVLSSGVRTDTHLAALALIERRAWWPFMFDNAAQQPIATRMPFSALAARVGGVPDPATVPDLDLCGFTHVLLLGPRSPVEVTRLDAAGLILVQDGPEGVLFAVGPRECPGNASPGARVRPDNG